MNNHQHQGITAVAFRSLSALREMSVDSMQTAILAMASYTAQQEGARDIWLEIFETEPEMSKRLESEREFYEWFVERREKRARESAAYSLAYFEEHATALARKGVMLTAIVYADLGLLHIWRDVFADHDDMIVLFDEVESGALTTQNITDWLDSRIAEQEYKREIQATRCEMTPCQNLLAFECIEIKGHAWRFCSECHERVAMFLGWLNTEVGVSFDFRLLGEVAE